MAGLNSSDDPWQERIAHWLDDLGLGAGLELTMQPLGGGAQNDLWSLDRGDIELVLRRPPLESTPDRLATFEREQTLLRALVDTDVPHAKLVGSGYDEVLGVPFFVMERVDGSSPTGLGAWPPPFHEDLEARSGHAFEIVGGAAMLANVDWRDRGLADFGHPDGFHDRQVDRWLTFYSRFRFRELPGIDAAAAWLRRNRPAHWTPGVMHGDYQFANVLFAHGAPAKLAAIIDWEMATIGDPLLDLGWALMAWGPEADDMPHARYMAMEGMP
ncbi:MAG: hypothetical protein JWN96_3610, partial [Mycobacterium sp.]|nr:hypothetical protein [Mycobacterium sp.]